MELEINGKLALITGAGRGFLGEGICRSLFQEGARILVTSRSANDLDRLVEELGGEAAHGRSAATAVRSATTVGKCVCGSAGVVPPIQSVD